MRASRPGGTRAGTRAAREGASGQLDGREAASARWGAGRRLAALLLVWLAVSGHTRSVMGPADGRPDHRGVDGVIAEVLVESQGAVVARGSAVVIAAREEAGESVCYVLTAGHVLSLAGGERGASVLVRLPADGPSHTIPAELLRQVDAGERDLAVLRTLGGPCRPAALAPPPGEGADVWLAGFPAAGGAHVVPGHVRDAVRRAGLPWSVEGAVTEGTSGGGVFDAGSGGLLGLIQGYWTVRLVAPGGRIAGETPAGRIAVIPMPRIRALLTEWGMSELLGD
jgi:trypsin-like peptidase